MAFRNHPGIYSYDSILPKELVVFTLYNNYDTAHADKIRVITNLKSLSIHYEKLGFNISNKERV